MTGCLQLPKRFHADMLKFVGHNIHIFRQADDGVHIIKVRDNVTVGDAVRRAVLRRIQDGELRIQPLSVQDHHLAELTAADDSDFLHI